jgi:flagellar basal-body rod protein FlgF
MNYGLSLAASGALTSLYRMDVLANNLANMTTVGFKPDIPGIRQRDVVRTEDGLHMMPSNKLLEMLGGGVMAAANHTKFEQGPMNASSNPFDLAVQGDGFFVVRDQSDSSADRFRLTRDGRFVRDNSGRLVSATTGMPVMDAANRPIVIADDAQVQIGADGSIRQGGQIVAQIQLLAVSDTSRLSKLGHGMFVAPSEVIAGRNRATGQIRQGMLEGSAVDPIAATMAITDAQKAAEANVSMMQAFDRLMDRAINGLGRTA